MVQVVQHQVSNHMTLSSNSSTSKRKKNNEMKILNGEPHRCIK
jgi:hypothetical protein